MVNVYDYTTMCVMVLEEAPAAGPRLEAALKDRQIKAFFSFNVRTPKPQLPGLAAR